MVKITNGIDTFDVTVGAFKTVFEPQGYKMVGATKTAPSNASEAVVDVNGNDSGKGDADDEFLASVIEKPVGQWSKDELRRYAAIESIDLSGARSVAEVRTLIKQHIG